MSTLALRAAVLVVAVGLAGCATRGDLVAQDHRLRGLIQEQKKAIDQVKRELERLRADIEEGRGGRTSGGSADRIAALEHRLAVLEGTAKPPATFGETPAPTDEVETPPAAPVEPPIETATKPTTPPTTLPPPLLPPPNEDEWRREVQQEQAASATMNVPEREEYTKSLDDLARRDCGKAVPALNSLANKNKGSALADNALYWAARCYAAKGDQNQAISKFYDVVTRYPKSDKAPAALWEQGNLFLKLGDTPDARLALGKLIRDYPNSAEAAKARQKLSELEH